MKKLIIVVLVSAFLFLSQNVTADDQDEEYFMNEGDSVWVGCNDLKLIEVIDDESIRFSYDGEASSLSIADGAVHIQEYDELYVELIHVFYSDTSSESSANIGVTSKFDKYYIGDTKTVDDHDITLLSIEYDLELGEDTYVLNIDGEVFKSMQECQWSWVNLEREDKYDDLWVGSNLVVSKGVPINERFVRLDAQTYDCYREGYDCKSRSHCNDEKEEFDCPDFSICCATQCYDSDGGDEPYTKGTVYDAQDSDCDPSKKIDQPDRCFITLLGDTVPASDRLQEFYCGEDCDGNKIEYTVHHCNCVDGACEGTFICQDSDVNIDYPDGKNPEEKGTCTDIDGENKDTCSPSGKYVTEYYCYNNECRTTEIDCIPEDSPGPIGTCVNGVCSNDQFAPGTDSGNTALSTFLGLLIVAFIGGYWYYSKQKPKCRKSRKRRR